jgi:hypothetical protein
MLSSSCSAVVVSGSSSTAAAPGRMGISRAAMVSRTGCKHETEGAWAKRVVYDSETPVGLEVVGLLGWPGLGFEADEPTFIVRVGNLELDTSQNKNLKIRHAR